MKESVRATCEQRQVQRQPVVPHATHKPRPIPHTQVYLQAQHIDNSVPICDSNIFGSIF